MIRKKMILGILLCIALTSGCFDFKVYPRYEIEELDNGQYILTSPDGVSYVTFEDNIWNPKENIFGENYSAAIGRCSLGYIFETASEVSLYVDNLRGSMAHYFFLEDTVLPELSIENINNAFLEPTDGNGSQKIVNEENTEKLIELYYNAEIHEVKNIHSMERILELYIECKQFRELYFHTAVYTDGTDYYMFRSFQYDSDEGITTCILCECTSVITTILY